MVQILPPKKNLGSHIGQATGQGLAQGIQTGVQRGILQDAFNKFAQNPNGNFREGLAELAPILLTTPGGAQALGDLASVLGTQSNNEAIRRSIDQRRQKLGSEPIQGATSQETQQFPQKNTEGQQVYRKGKTPVSAETPFPEITAGPTTQKEMSPRQLENYALDTVENSLNTGKPISYTEAFKLATEQNKEIRDSNSQILKEKIIREEAQSKLAQSMVTRAKNSGLIKSPEDITVVEKLALQAKNAPNESEGWEYVRSKMRAFDSAKEGLRRELSLGNPVTNFHRRLFGNYKDEQQIIKDLQVPLNQFRKLGLTDEAKDILVNDLGLGNEQAHAAIFPLDDKEKQDLQRFPSNSQKNIPIAARQAGVTESHNWGDSQEPFPGEEMMQSPDKFNKFKDELEGFLKQNKDIDLVLLRGNLNREKRYAWQDIYRAIDELVAERRFDPDLEQEKQLNTIKQAPIPGVGAYFQNIWSGKK